jgi:hypothetical protein
MAESANSYFPEPDTRHGVVDCAIGNFRMTAVAELRIRGIFALNFRSLVGTLPFASAVSHVVALRNMLRHGASR